MTDSRIGGASDPPSETAAPDAATVVGLLADPDRRRVVAALVLGATEPADVGRLAGLAPGPLARAAARLVDGGLVSRRADGSLALDDMAFARAARQARATPAQAPPVDEREAVLRRFVRDGRLTAIPMSRGKRLVVLDLLAQQFDPGQRYPEKTVNEVLARWHPDTAALRRYLVDEGFLERAASVYWRAGGTVDV